MDRLEALLAEMTLEEKVSLAAGSGPWHTTPIERLGIPAIKVSDGPAGVRGDLTTPTTAASFPCGIALGASFDADLVEAVGRAIGEEAKTKQVRVVLGPTINLQRHPLGGRHFEAYSEDPRLTAILACAFIRGVQSTGVGACAKHFACNDSEFERMTISSEVDERSLREVYLAPFEAAVREADVWTVMAAYNRLNGTYCSEHADLLGSILRDAWGFEGLVMSDWGGTHSTAAAANAGLDLEMPGPARHMGRRLEEAALRGEVPAARIDEIARRVLRLAVRTGALDLETGPVPGVLPEEPPEQSIDTPAHRALARRAAAESIVLLKNEGVLPLHPRRLERVAILGPNAERGQTQGGGSASLSPHAESHPLEALRARLGDDVEVIHAPGAHTEKYLPAIPRQNLRPTGGGERPGLTLEYWDGEGFAGEPAFQRVVGRCRAAWFGEVAPGVSPRHFAARYSGQLVPDVDGVHTFGCLGTGRVRLFVDGELVVDNWTDPEPGDGFFGYASAERRGELSLEAGRAVPFQLDFQLDHRDAPAAAGSGLQFGMRPPEPVDRLEAATSAATDADAVILIVGMGSDWETEGHDRGDYALPGGQNELVRAVCAANPNTVVVLNTGSPVALPFLEDVPALLQTWYGGEEAGNALADVLFGRVNPSGRLPCSWPARLDDAPAFATYPGEGGRVRYHEGLEVGHRWYDARNVPPLFPFGFGLSYTTFAFGRIQCEDEIAVGEPLDLSVEVANTGDLSGMEVVQVYVARVPRRGGEPVRVLRAVAKKDIAAGWAERVAFRLAPRDFARFDPDLGDFVIDPGPVEIAIGSSAADILTKRRIRLVRSD